MTHRRMSRAALAAGVAALAFAPVPAQAQSAQNLGTMVISANRTETEANKVGSSVTVITAEEIEKTQAATLEDVLEDVPGLYVYSNGNAQNNTRFKLRGFDSGRVLVLVDGVKIDNQASQMYDRPYNHLQAADIERVEVLRGNQSSLYGSDAIGGVISITTKSGRNSSKILEGVATAEVGSFVTRRGSVSAWGRYGDVYYKAAGAGLATHGDDNRPMVDPDEADGSRSVNYDFKVGADALKDVGILDLLNVEATYNTMRGDAEYDSATSGMAGNPATADTEGFLHQETDTARIQVNAKMFDGRLDNTFSASRMDAYVVARSDRYSGSANRYWGDLEKYEYQGILRPFDGHSLVFGADQERDHFRTKASSSQNAALVNSSVFGDYAVDVTDNLTLSAGLRRYSHDTFGETTTYRTTASYRVPETGTRLHGSYGTGFKAPTLVQALYNRETAVANGFDETLNPEESRGYDVGVEQSLLGDRLVTDVTFFNNRMTDAIESRGPSGNRYYVNIGSVRNMGFETSADFDVTDEVRLSGTYTYTQSRDNATGLQIDQTPVHQGAMRVAYAPKAVEGFDTWMRMRAAGKSFDTPSTKIGRKEVGGYATFDLGADYEIDKSFSVYGRVENLLDKNYGQMYGFENAGIGAYTGLRVKF